MTQWSGEHDYDDVIQAVSLEAGIAVPVIQGLIATESGFNAAAYKPESAGRASIGLTQLLLATAQSIGYSGAVGDPSALSGLYDPQTNVELGVRYLAQQYARAGNWWGAYSAYNGGWNPARAMGVPATVDLLPLRVIVNSNPLTYRDVQLGEYGNQPAVDRFTANVRYFQGQAPITGSGGGDLSDGGDGASVVAPVALLMTVGALVVAYVLTRRR